jgi:hypothetical protein
MTDELDETFDMELPDGPDYDEADVTLAPGSTASDDESGDGAA